MFQLNRTLLTTLVGRANGISFSSAIATQSRHNSSTNVNLTLEDNGVLECSLIAPPNNLLTSQSLRELNCDLEEALKDKEARILALSSGVSGVFSYGLDPQHVTQLNLEGRINLFKELLTSYKLILTSPIPTIARIEGPAFAGGAILALACDMKSFSPTASISFSEAKVGLPLPQFICTELRNCVSSHYAFYNMGILGRQISAKNALEFGFATHLHKNEEEFAALLDDQIGKVGRLSRHVLAYSRRQYRKESFRQVDSFLKDLDTKKANHIPYAEFLSNKFVGEGLRAFVEQRPPIWTK